MFFTFIIYFVEDYIIHISLIQFFNKITTIKWNDLSYISVYRTLCIFIKFIKIYQKDAI